MDLLDRLTPVIAGQKIPIPAPTLCPPCRSQRRLAHRNERRLYHRLCSLTGASIISIFGPDTPFPVYAPDAWHGDGWDAGAFGRSYDSERSFFDQFQELFLQVPRMSLAVVNVENCPYVNQVWYSKNCYLCVDGGFNDDALFCYATYHSTSLADASFTRDAEMSYELLDSSGVYNGISLMECKTCSDAYYCFGCNQCKHIAFCSNLRGREYCIRNKQVSKEQWEILIRSLQSGSASLQSEHRQEFADVLRNATRRENSNIQCENCTGDHLSHSHDCTFCFDGDRSQDLRYCARMDEKIVSAGDIDMCSMLEVGYEGLSVGGHGIFFTSGSWSQTNSNLLYCNLAVSSSDCFGCASIKNKRFCILNKQYSKEEYEDLVPQIIAKMRSDGEWGEFFPPKLSPFAYNETVALEYFPLTKEEVLERGWHWRDEIDEVPKVARIIPAPQLPDSIDAVTDDILHSAIECEVTKRPFRVIRQELDFYRRMRLPLPRLHPDERHRRRMALRNPRKLWSRSCGKCGKGIETSYSPQRPERVLCESCYLKEMY